MSIFDWFQRLRSARQDAREEAALTMDLPRLGYNASFATATAAVRRRLVDAGFEPQSLSELDDQSLLNLFEQEDLTVEEVELMDGEQLRETFRDTEQLPMTPLCQLLTAFADVGIDETTFSYMDEYERREAIENAGFEAEDFLELFEEV